MVMFDLGVFRLISYFVLWISGFCGVGYYYYYYRGYLRIEV